ncbi:hypothetical protein cypCar_00024989 [Cyprinus carpio]|nr:hypothetical protein cypCar_00024989 [Cyprinus carpio]
MDLVAKIFSTYDGPDGRFRDRLKLDHQTGSLTITNTTIKHAGPYKVETEGVKYSSKMFSVSVYDYTDTLTYINDYCYRLCVSDSVGLCFCCCWISVDVSCSRVLLQKTQKKRSRRQVLPTAFKKFYNKY